MNKLECIRSFQEAQLLRKDKKKPALMTGLRSEGVWSEGNETPRWVNEKEVSQITDIAVQTLRNHRFRGVGLPYYRIGHSIKYRLDEVLSYMGKHRVEPRE